MKSIKGIQMRLVRPPAILLALVLAGGAATAGAQMPTSSDAEARFNAGLTHLRDGRPKIALAEFQAAIRQDPKNPYFHKGLGLAYATLKRFGDAADAFRKALELNPYYTDVRNDLGMALVLAGKSFAEKRGLEPLGSIVAHAKVAEEPPNLLTVPGNAGKLALEKAGWNADDLDLVEINEAFAGVAIHSTRILGVDPDIVNVNGGALALGHPVGASGARILTTLLYELRRRGGGKGLAAICSGGGQGDAVLVEV